jgi:tRNA G46 methylase TrmB
VYFLSPLICGFFIKMTEITEAHARELAKQAARKAELVKMCRADLAGVDRMLFEAGCGHGHWLTDYAEANPGTICAGIDLISWRVRKGDERRPSAACKISISTKRSLANS